MTDWKEGINADMFYQNYYGHDIEDVEKLTQYARASNRKIVWLIGDSSLDNKHWMYFEESTKDAGKLLSLRREGVWNTPAVNGYEDVLHPARSVRDVAYWLNFLLERESPEYFAINCAREESTLGERVDNGLMPLDEFVRDNIAADDILIASAGGNDVALAPSFATVTSMVGLNFFSTKGSLKSGGGLGSGHIKKLFGQGMQNFLSEVTCKQMPAKVIPCMIYYPCEKGSGWSDTLLKLLRYNSNPGKLQAVINMAFETCTKKLELPGTIVAPVHLAGVLDSQDEADYVDRVEPSTRGGEKMAAAFLEVISGRTDLIGSRVEPENASDCNDDPKEKKKVKKIMKKVAKE